MRLGLNRTLDLIYMPTNFHQNISKGIRVIKQTSFPQLNSFKRSNSFRLIAIKNLVGHGIKIYVPVYLGLIVYLPNQLPVY